MSEELENYKIDNITTQLFTIAASVNVMDKWIADLKDSVVKLESHYYSDGDLSAIHGQIDNIINNHKYYEDDLKRLKESLNDNDERIHDLENIQAESRLIRIEDCFSSALNISKDEEITSKKPHKCPVCNGHGKVETPNTIRFDILMGDKNIGVSACSSCKGKGIVWG